MKANETDGAEEAERVLFSALEALADENERDCLLGVACRDRPELRRRMEELLGLREDAEEFFGFSALELGSPPASGAEEVDARIGRYRLIERIGEGGCGVVYLAEQEEPVRRKVALKIIRLGMDTESVVARFENERQALAAMDHPNIARVFDAGTTASGRPFFVMELVDGEPITKFCDRRHVGLRERLGLFVQVCQAIQHAHQKGVVHRDIKPTNVLVREVGGSAIPQVIDFGVAKATGEDPDCRKTRTGFGHLLGTPAYMSPEQAGGGIDVDTRSDVHGLGVLLYELLLGRPPLDPALLDSLPTDELLRRVREQETEPPSRALRALDGEGLAALTGRMRSDRASLVAQLAGDLDWIVLKALEKDRRRRYQTATGLAMDVERFLRDQPVLARPPSRRYLLWKAMRRNRLTYAAVAAVVLALGIGLATSTWLWQRERRAREEQQRLRQVAEESQRREGRLQAQAIARERVAQASLRLRYNDRAGAEELLDGIPSAELPSSLEAADVFQSLAVWHLEAGRMASAARHYASLARVIWSVDRADDDRVSRHLLPAASVLLVHGSEEEYDEFRHMAMERFGDTSRPVVAEQVLKACLLVPPDEPLLRRLAKLEAVVVEGFRRDGPEPFDNDNLESWACFSLALAHYRQGRNPEAIEWARRCLDYPGEFVARRASGMAILELARVAAGQRHGTAEVFRELEAGWRKRLDGPVTAGDWKEGFFFDWINVRLLVEEGRSGS